MNKLDIVAILVGLLIGISAVLAYEKYASGDEPILDNSGCNTTQDDVDWSSTHHYGFVGGGISDCYAPKIYQQNTVIEKQNEQIIKLSAIATCGDYKNWYSDANGLYGPSDDVLNKCISKLVNMTK